MHGIVGLINTADCTHVRTSLIPWIDLSKWAKCPTPSFSSLLSTVLSSDEQLGVGLGTRLQSARIQTPACIPGCRSHP